MQPFPTLKVKKALNRKKCLCSKTHSQIQPLKRLQGYSKSAILARQGLSESVLTRSTSLLLSRLSTPLKESSDKDAFKNMLNKAL